MSYLAFKEKMNSFKNDAFQRRKLLDQIQVFFVAAFWIILTSGLLYYDYNRKQLERASFKVPNTPDVESLLKYPQNSMPQVGALNKQ